MNIPSELARRPNWIVWKAVTRGNAKAKLPFHPLTHRLASTSNPSDWCPLDQAKTALATQRYAGLGFVFKRGDGLFGVDLDSCFSDLWNLTEWAANAVRAFDSYTEVSPSSTGVKIFALGSFDEKGKVFPMPTGPAGGKRPAIEVYGWGRFFAFTGTPLVDTPAELNDASTALLRYTSLMREERPPKIRAPWRPVEGDDAKKVSRARAYLRKVPPRSDSLAGCNNRTFRACCVLIYEIGLNFDDAMCMLHEWNMRSETPWSNSELLRKMQDAQKKGN